MKLPKSVKIGCHKYSIVIDDKIANGEGVEYWGLCNRGEFKITISKECFKHESILANTILHECLHAIWAERGLNHQENPPEELIVTLLSNGIQQLYADNPQLRKYLP